MSANRSALGTFLDACCDEEEGLGERCGVGDATRGGVEGPRPYIGITDGISQPDLHVGQVGSTAIEGEESH